MKTRLVLFNAKEDDEIMCIRLITKKGVIIDATLYDGCTINEEEESKIKEIVGEKLQTS